MKAVDGTRTLSLGLVGGGFMGEAVIDGLLKAGVVRAEDLSVGEALEPRRQYLQRTYTGLRVAGDAAEAVAGCDAVLIGVKPQDFAKLAARLRGQLQHDQVVISIMAGVRIAGLRDALGHQRLVRVMPNTPASLGLGFSTWLATTEVDEQQLGIVRRILSALGLEAQVHEERYLDMATAVAGSGPAYVFLFIESLIEAAVHIGLPRGLSREMVLQTVLGSVKMAMATERHPAELRNMVTSPAGTTAEGLLVLERTGLRAALTEAVVAAHERSRALGD